MPATRVSGSETSPHSALRPELQPSPRPLGFASTQASVLLDLVRGLAAILVLLEHWRNLFFLDYPQIVAHQIPAHRILFAIPYLLASGGHQAVVVFFILSGYLISGSIFRTLRLDAWSWRDYLLHRVVRLWIVLIPGLIIAAACDFLGLHLLRPSAVALYAGLSGDHVVPSVRASFHLSTWLGNLFFLQQTFVPPFGSDGPLWSIANEFWYYLLFPLGLLALLRRTRLWRRLACIALVAAIALTIAPVILVQFPIWLMGTALAVIPSPPLALSPWPWLRTAAAVVYVAATLAFERLRTSHTVVADMLFGLLTAGFLYLLLSARKRAREQSLGTRLSRSLARFSYTLYVMHLPLLVLIAALSLGKARWIPDPWHVLIASTFLALTLVCAYTLAFFTEFRTDRLREWIERPPPSLMYTHSSVFKLLLTPGITMPKLKTHSGAAKRFKKTGTGKFKRGHSKMRHILTSKSNSVKSRLGKSGLVSEADSYNVARMLPYA